MKSARNMLVLLVLVSGSMAAAQNADVQGGAPVQPVPIKGEGPQAVPLPPAPPTPAFESLAKKGPDGKVIPLEGVVDIAAFSRNAHFNQSSLEAIKPAILNWMADIDQLAIDNSDFLEKLDPGEGNEGVMDHFNIEDKVLLTQLSLMMNQLMSAGPLTAHLEAKGVITRDQSGLNQQITGDYLQQCMNEIQTAPAPPEFAGKEEEARKWRVNKLTRFLYALSCNDSVVSYRRMLVDAAPNIDAIVASLGLSGETAAKVNGEIPKVNAAKTRSERGQTVRKLIAHLTFDQRRQFLTKSRELAPIKDPYANNGK